MKGTCRPLVRADCVHVSSENINTVEQKEIGAVSR